MRFSLSTIRVRDIFAPASVQPVTPPKRVLSRHLKSPLMLPNSNQNGKRGQILIKLKNTEFHKNPFRDSWIITDWWTYTAKQAGAFSATFRCECELKIGRNLKTFRVPLSSSTIQWSVMNEDMDTGRRKTTIFALSSDFSPCVLSISLLFSLHWLYIPLTTHTTFNNGPISAHFPFLWRYHHN